MMNRRSLVFCLPIVAVGLALVGCTSQGPEMADVSGTVTLDGAPVEGAGVVFTPEAGGLPANATTDASGKFSLEAMVGSNAVAVTKTREVGGAAPAADMEEGASPENMGENAQLEYLVPKKYGLAKTSGLKFDVKKGMDAVSLELSSK